MGIYSNMSIVNFVYKYLTEMTELVYLFVVKVSSSCIIYNFLGLMTQ
jgi:hypothetical protein